MHVVSSQVVMHVLCGYYRVLGAVALTFWLHTILLLCSIIIKCIAPSDLLEFLQSICVHLRHTQSVSTRLSYTIIYMYIYR